MHSTSDLYFPVGESSEDDGNLAVVHINLIMIK